MVSGHVTCAANWREDREARMLRGVGDSSAPSGQKTERDSFHGLRFAFGAGRFDCVVHALRLGGEVVDEPGQHVQRGEDEGDHEEQRERAAGKDRFAQERMRGPFVGEVVPPALVDSACFGRTSCAPLEVPQALTSGGRSDV
jgi:hypothetical protein